MPYSVSCQCGQTLVVQEQNAGQWLRCPRCQQNVLVPQPSPRALPVGSAPTPAWATTPPAAATLWHLRTADGQAFGPISKAELDGWVGEGLVAGDAHVLQQGQPQWQLAREIYPVLQASGNVAQANNNVVVYVDNSNRQESYRSAGRHKKQHRAGLILTLPLLGWFVFPLLCIFAWVMGADDLKQMRAGRMDRSGEGMTTLGMIIGAIGTCLMILGVVLIFLILMMAIAGSAA
ncbi:MAG TPA: DUF4339 domain-containing protein [Pirellulaceae bacterium]|nr:DUF4339 domain-containing protein [Pirellulaceae bacterium]